MNEELIAAISAELKIKKAAVTGAVQLLDQGNTVPFIARYRKELTGGLDENQLRVIEERVDYLRNLEKRKEEVIRLIAEQDKMTGELEEKIRQAKIRQEVEDLYLPYRQKRLTRATKAKEKGLEPLAVLIWEQELTDGNLEELAAGYLNPELELGDSSDVYQGARDIIAERIADDAEIRKGVRLLSQQTGVLASKLRDGELDPEHKYQIYYQYTEAVGQIPPHRVLAINRGEKEEVLQVKLRTAEAEIFQLIEKKVITKQKGIFAEQLGLALEDAYKRLIAPSIEREIRNNLTEKAEEHAIEVFSRNLRALLLQPPLRGHVVIGIDPGFRTGSKVCVVDPTGKVLETGTIYPHPPQKEMEKAKKVVQALITKYQVRAIAIGNGTASRETEFFIAELIRELVNGANYTIVNEAGASVYSASKLASQEFPELDVSIRGAISIARRLQDPLAELVKIEPRSIGVGLYQHDVNPTRLEESLKKVVESAVNYVGVDLNTASYSLLQYISGINSSVAKNIVKHREEQGPFRSREELKAVHRLGGKTFTQAAGFLRLASVDDPLAMTPIHPESYPATELLIRDLGFCGQDLANQEQLKKLRHSLEQIKTKEKATELALGLPTLLDIIAALKQPGRDPRDQLPKPLFRTDVLKLEDLKPDMVLQGTVRNVVDFGAFVDIGVKEDGLVHISQLSDRYVQNPLELVQVGDVVSVRILEVEAQRKRIALSMKL